MLPELPKECETSGVTLTGKSAAERDVLPIADAAFCKALCDLTDACAYFSHDADRGECALLSDVGDARENEDATSGAAGCNGEQVLVVCLSISNLP